MKRISFSEEQATRILEWYYGLVQGTKEECCEQCIGIRKRLESFIKDPQNLKQVVDDNPYFP